MVARTLWRADHRWLRCGHAYTEPPGAPTDVTAEATYYVRDAKGQVNAVYTKRLEHALNCIVDYIARDPSGVNSEYARRYIQLRMRGGLTLKDVVRDDASMATFMNQVADHVIMSTPGSAYGGKTADLYSANDEAVQNMRTAIERALFVEENAAQGVAP